MVMGDLNTDGLADVVLGVGACERRAYPCAVQSLLGTLSGPFLRGDASADQRVDLTDAVFTLSYLFLAGTAPRCLDASDANDDGAVEVSDATYLLNHLFLQGSPPPPPYPLTGVDSTLDAHFCEG